MCKINLVFLVTLMLMILITTVYSEDRYFVGHWTSDVTIADVDNDSFVDMLVSNSKDDNISVLMNKGDGTFESQIFYQVGDIPEQATASDVNNDGYVDLLVSNVGDDDVSVLINKGDGTFYPHVRYFVGNLPRKATVCDVNKDGWIDMLFSNGLSGSISVMLNNGDGYFIPQQVIYEADVNYFITELLTVDISGDGFNDIIFGKFNFWSKNYSVCVILNIGDGTFTESVDYEIYESYPLHIITSDITNDGYPDIIAGGELCVSVLINNGNGTFSDEVRYCEKGEETNFATADLDNDGFEDLIVSFFDLNLMSILFNNGDGTFGTEMIYETGKSPQLPVNSDINNDGYIDILLNNRGSGDISLFLNKGDGTFSSQQRYGLGELPYSAKTSDIDNDGLIDLIVCDYGTWPDYTGFISCFKNLGNDNFNTDPADIITRLHFEPRSSVNRAFVKPGEKLKIIMDLQTPGRSVKGDIYIIMVDRDDPYGIYSGMRWYRIYSAMDWEEGLIPFLSGITLPASTKFSDMVLLDVMLPNKTPPISAECTYDFYMAVFDPVTGEILSNLAYIQIGIYDHLPPC